MRFSTYAVPVIMGEIRRFLRDDGPVHISRTIHDRRRQIDAFRQRFIGEHQREPTIDETAGALAIDRGDVLLAMESRCAVRSLSEPVRGDSGLRLMDVLGTDPMQAVDRRLTLSRLLSELTPEERTLIVRRYFLSHTQSRIALDMNVSQVQVSRMERRIINRMRALAGLE